VTGGASFIATKIASIADSHVGSTPAKVGTIPSRDTAGGAAAVRNMTARFDDNAHATAANAGLRVNEAGKDLAAQLPEGVQKLGEPTPEYQKGEFRKMADEGWEQATIAAKGIAGAVGMVGKSLSESTHRAIEHNLGKETDRVAQDIGQAGQNIGSAALSVGTAASTAVHGSNTTTVKPPGTL